MLRYLKNKKWRFSDILFRTGVCSLPRTPPPISRVLLYHGLDLIGSTKYNTKFISQENFERQIKYLTEMGQIVSLSDYFNQRFDKSKLTTCITFDDGYKNNLTRALPVLEKYNVPATIFVTTINSLGESILWPDFVDLATPLLPEEISCAGRIFKKNSRGILYSKSSNQSLKEFFRFKDRIFIAECLREIRENHTISFDSYSPDYYELLTDDDIYKLANHPLITIGVHGLYHTDWSQMNREDCLFELQNCKTKLSQITKRPISAVAFPFGSYNHEVLESCNKSGFTEVLAIDLKDKVSNPTLSERLGINPFISFEYQMHAIFAGKYT